ncbi:hypothetical protein SO802_001830 [Lithocarpus litseifolius]|uniref:Uncharacterized protein n=1 Tax=Lithocarpus litseifolius TaxID=425828 RepID=A0AAW2E0U8_9ROSI
MALVGLLLDKNTVRNGGGQRAGKTMVRSLASLVEEYRAANEKACCLNLAVLVKWHPPGPPWFKMNVEGAVFTD